MIICKKCDSLLPEYYTKCPFCDETVDFTNKKILVKQGDVSKVVKEEEEVVTKDVVLGELKPSELGIS